MKKIFISLALAMISLMPVGAMRGPKPVGAMRGPKPVGAMRRSKTEASLHDIAVAGESFQRGATTADVNTSGQGSTVPVSEADGKGKTFDVLGDDHISKAKVPLELGDSPDIKPIKEEVPVLDPYGWISGSTTVFSDAYDELSDDIVLPKLERPYDSATLKKAMEEACKHLHGCPGVVKIKGKTAVVGDLHGDLQTFRQIRNFIALGFDDHTIDNAVFLGDIMDRGSNSALTLLELLEFYNKYPGKVYIVRGNHETGFMYLCHPENDFPAHADHCLQELGEDLFKFFDMLPYGAVINEKTLAVHGGVPSKENWSRFYEAIKWPEYRFLDRPTILQVLWSDYKPELDGSSEVKIIPNDIRGGVANFYNEAAVTAFLNHGKKFGFENLQYMIRGHQPTLGTFHQSPNKVITTVFSALENQGDYIVDQGAQIALIDAQNPPAEWFTLL